MVGRVTSQAKGTFTQYPIKLAWAITIHKSQGLTFDKVIIDLGSGAFVNGQLYTAISRCRTLDGIVLKRNIKIEDIIQDQRLIEF
jgi:ATP-dependent DNA helicase PIF1